MYTNQSISKFADVVREFLFEKDAEFKRYPFLTSRNVDGAITYGKAERAIQLLGGRLETKDETEWQDAWGDGVIRGLREEDGAAFKIEIPAHTSIERDIFTIAHELGHLFLHLKYGSPEFRQDDEFTDSIMTRSGRNATEYEANHFAACLLMPEDTYKAVAVETSNNVSEIANKFGVSPSAALMRGKFLGVFPW